ncbi:MAG TPA: glycosyltransferase [Bacillota bacterium]|nr:glycosyltransferase [Bacillota bacterium]
MKILILSESIAGSGHEVAAQNIAKGIRRIFPEADMKVESALPKVSPLLEKWSSKAYMKAIRYAPFLWGWAYQRDKEWSHIGKQLLGNFVAQRLESYLMDEKPDIVLCTHAFCLGGLAELKKKLTPTFRLGASLTDYCINHFWIFDEIDYYFVGSESLKQKMIEQYNLPSTRIHVTGIAIDPDFSVSKDRISFRNRFGIPLDSFLVLVSGGGLGIAPYKEIIEALGNVIGSLFIVVILGRNSDQRQRVDEATSTVTHPVIVLDFVKNMSDWMMAADLMIGKPGGLTVSEALACELPLFIYKPIPGQEERNSRFLMDSEVALRANNPIELRAKLESLLSKPQDVERMKERSRELKRPNAAMDVGQIVFELESSLPPLTNN